MKTKQWIFIILAFVFASSALAGGTPKMNVTSIGKTKVFVAVTQEKSTNQELSIISEDGETLYNDQPWGKRKDITRLFDLSKLKDGSYTLKFENEDSFYKREIRIKNGQVTVQPLVNEPTPVFVYDKNVLKVSYMNIKLNKVEVYIYGEEGLIHKSFLGNNLTLQKGFDFSKLEKGNYNIVLASAGDKYSYFVEK